MKNLLEMESLASSSIMWFGYRFFGSTPHLIHSVHPVLLTPFHSGGEVEVRRKDEPTTEPTVR